MGLGSLFGRVFQWLANEVIVKSLAENPGFQRFAVRSSEQAKQMSKSASQAVRNIAESENVTHLKKVKCLVLFYFIFSLSLSIAFKLSFGKVAMALPFLLTIIFSRTRRMFLGGRGFPAASERLCGSTARRNWGGPSWGPKATRAA